MTNKQIDLWQSSFGDEYNKRQQHSVEARESMWNDIFHKTETTDTILEVGAGTGVNLVAINGLVTDHLFAVEVNGDAAQSLNNLGICKKIWNQPWEDFDDDQKFDLVFTSGVLIHVHPNNRKAFMQKIIDHSNRYVVAIEYMSKEPREVNYRGVPGALWVADYGQMYIDMGLKLLDCKFYYKPLTALDNLTAFVLEKQ